MRKRCVFLPTNAKKTMDRTCVPRGSLKENKHNRIATIRKRQLNFLRYVIRRVGLENSTRAGYTKLKKGREKQRVTLVNERMTDQRQREMITG